MTSESQSVGTAGKLKRQLLPLHQHHLTLEQGSYCKERTFIKINKGLLFNIITFKKHDLSITVSKATSFQPHKYVIKYALLKKFWKNIRSLSMKGHIRKTSHQPHVWPVIVLHSIYPWAAYLLTSRMQPFHTQGNLCKHLTTLFFWLHLNHTKKCIDRW